MLCLEIHWLIKREQSSLGLSSIGILMRYYFYRLRINSNQLLGANRRCLLVKENAGYGGYTDRAIDIRVDDNPEPFKELGRLLNYAQMNYSWNEAWTLFTQKKYQEALPLMERTAKLAPENPEVLYDFAVIQLSTGEKEAALKTLEKAVSLNPKLKQQAFGDNDLKSLRSDAEFQKIVK